ERYRARLPWQHVHWFWGDDRFVPPDDPHSNARMTMKALLELVPVAPQNIHPIPTDAASPQESARLYESELQRFYGAERLDPRRPPFALGLVGVGGGGHAALAFPRRPRRWRDATLGRGDRQTRSRAIGGARESHSAGLGIDARDALPRQRQGQAGRAWTRAGGRGVAGRT